MYYEELRTEYDAEFDRLRTAVRELQSITQNPASDKVAEEAARQRVDLALGLYRERRDNLAAFMASCQSVYADSQLASMRTPAMGRQAAD